MGLSYNDIAKAHGVGRAEGRRDGELAGMKYLAREMVARGFDERDVNSVFIFAVSKWKRNQHRIPREHKEDEG